MRTRTGLIMHPHAVADAKRPRRLWRNRRLAETRKDHTPSAALIMARVHNKSRASRARRNPYSKKNRSQENQQDV